MRRLVIAIVSLAASLLVTGRPLRAELDDRSSGGVVDLVLIYEGGAHRQPWTEERLQPYVTFRDPVSAREQWLYDGFLFLEIKDGRGAEFMKCCKLRPASRADWSWLLDRLFAPGESLEALERVVAKTSARIGAPARPRRVYLGLPEPILHSKSWGALDGQELDFDVAADRVSAVKWYLGELQRRWRTLAPAHLQLAGFYWVAETADDSRDVLPVVADLVHRAGGTFIWIPYWSSRMRMAWRELGFDRAYYQPNHFFKPAIPDQRILDACAQARATGAGLEVELDDRVFTEAEFRPRIDAYLHGYSKDGAAAEVPMAWYEGGGTLAKLAGAAEPLDRAIYQRIARFVLARQAVANTSVRRRPPRTSPASR